MKPIKTFKITSKPISYIGFLVITVIVLLIEFAFYIDGKTYLQFIMQTLEQSFTIA